MKHQKKKPFVRNGTGFLPPSIGRKIGQPLDARNRNAVQGMGRSRWPISHTDHCWSQVRQVASEPQKKSGRRWWLQQVGDKWRGAFGCRCSVLVNFSESTFKQTHVNDKKIDPPCPGFRITEMTFEIWTGALGLVCSRVIHVRQTHSLKLRA